MKKNKIKVYRQIKTLLTLQGAFEKGGRKTKVEDLSIIKNACLVCDETSGKILFVGLDSKLNSFLKNYSFQNKLKFKVNEVLLKNKTVLPGFIDCHTHSVFAGNRFEEFELRNQGATYQEIAASGGGILSTMRATREISFNNLFELTKNRISNFYNQGVTTVEVKSGYALNLKHEIKQLKVIKKLNELREFSNCIPTFLGAHALPPEFKSYEEYLNEIVQNWLPQIKKNKLANRVDIFIEKGFFEKSAAEKYLKSVKALGFEIAIHADQLTLSGGTELAVALGAFSADHMIQVKDKEISAISSSETTSVLLPTADLYLKCNYPPARALIDSGARVALATDFNPGSSPTQDIMLVGLLARLYMKMTLPEVIAAFTVNGAYALGLQNQIGCLRVGHQADLIATSEDWQGLFYQAGQNPVERVYSTKNI